MERQTDEFLVEQAAAGNTGMFEELVRRYERQLFSFAFRFTHDALAAQDVVQDTFVKAWSKLRSFNKEHMFRTWVYAICRNTALDFLKKKKDIPFSSYETEAGGNVLTDSLEDAESIPSALLDRMDARVAAEFLLENISPTYRDVVVLHYLHQCTFEEISAILHKPLDTVKSQHRRALVHMRAILAHAPKQRS